MPKPYESTPYSVISLSGTLNIDALLGGTKWDGGLGSGATLTYSFLSDNSYYARQYSSDNEYWGSYALSDTQQTVAIETLGAWAAVANIKLTQTVDSISNAGDLRFGGYSYMPLDTAAWAYFPGGAPVCGDVWIGPATSDPDPIAGSYDYLTFLHEIGHALGLKHPFEDPNVLPTAYDDVRYTVMSYNNQYDFEPTTPMLLDIAAIQYLYGANMSWHTGNDTYQWQAGQQIFETIWDAGGNDTLSAANQDQGVTFDLNAGSFSSIGAIDNLAIAYGAQIENAIGSAYADTLIGNAAANTLDGGNGNDILDGGNGADTMIGGYGDDTYYVDNRSDRVIESDDPEQGGIDLVISSVDYTLGDFQENLTLTGKAVNATGNDLDNRLTGNAAANVLDGGAGADTLSGGLGNDIYYVDDSGDLINESDDPSSGGIDQVISSISYTLGDYVENLTLSGTAALDATGNALANVLIGNAADNILDGGTGADTLSGGFGDDTYYVDDTGDRVQESSAKGGVDTVISSVSYTLGNYVENLTLSGTTALDGTGNALANVLIGNAAANVLNGGTGADTLSGGLGDDTYYVDNLGDQVVESADPEQGGIDTVIATISYGLGDYVENLTLLGNAARNATGNDLDNVLTGTAAANVLDGRGGADTLIGGAGNDTYYVDDTGDTVVESAARDGVDTVISSVSYTLGAYLENLTLTGAAAIDATGNVQNNRLIGNAAANVLDGGAGADTLIGGLGDDSYYVDNSRDRVQEGSNGGVDTVFANINYTLGNNLENLTLLGSTALNGSGNNLANILIGNDAANRLDGRGGADILSGGLGDDTYYVDNLGDRVIESDNPEQGGIDLVISSVDYTLGDFQENLTLTGKAVNATGNDLDNRLTGNAAANTLDGGNGNDILDGGKGADTLIGGYGDDTYYVDNRGDRVVESDDPGQGGVDTVISSIDYTLGDFQENLTLTGRARNATGNDLDNVLTGNAAANTLDGGNGNDTLDGGAGNDVLIGGGGTDVLTGGSGADRFVFKLLGDSGLGALRDLITDFNASEGDKIDLRGIDANDATTFDDAFTFIGADLFANDATGQLRFSDGVLYGSTNADSTAEFEIQLVGVTSLSSNALLA